MSVITKGLYTEAKYVFQNTFLSGDIDEDKIIPYILRAQELYVFDWLGQPLYERIDDLIDTGDINLPANEDYLLLARDYIAPAVDYLTASEFLRYGLFTAGDNGIYKKNAEDSTPATQQELSKLIGALMSTAENKWSVAYDYLCQNTGRYPEYVTVQSEQRPPSHEVYNLGIL